MGLHSSLGLAVYPRPMGMNRYLIFLVRLELILWQPCGILGLHWPLASLLAQNTAAMYWVLMYEPRLQAYTRTGTSNTTLF